MNQFITLTSRDGIKLRINPSCIKMYYNAGSGNEFTAIIFDGNCEYVIETLEEIDLLIQGEENTNSMRMATREMGKSKIPFNETPRTNP